MGGGVSVEQVQERVTNIMATFTTEFALAYGICLLKKIKREMNAEPDPYQLEECPPADWVLGEAGCTSRSGILRQVFKPRYFVARNESNNFRIDYYKNEKSKSGTPAGTINCAGLWVRDWDSNETADWGEHGLKLVPYNDRLRTFYVQFENAKLKEDWERIFRNAYYMANNPQDEDPLIAEAFVIAYTKTRWQYSIWSWWTSYCSEGELLGLLVADVINRDILVGAYAAIPDSPLKSTQVNFVQKSIDQTVSSAVNAGWTGAVNAAKAGREALESKAREMTGPIFEAQAAMKNSIVSSIGGIVNPVMEKVGGAVLKPVIGKVLAPITRAYIAGMNSMVPALKAVIAKPAGEQEDAFRELRRQIDYYWSGPLEQANQFLYDMYNSQLGEIAGLFSENYSAYTIYYLSRGDVRQLAHRAVHNLQKGIKEGQDASSVLRSIVPKYVHDSCYCLQKMVKGILYSMIDGTLNSEVIQPAQEPLKELESQIPEIVKAFIGLSDLLKEVVEGIGQGAVGAIADGALQGECAKVSAVREELQGSI